MYVIVAGSNFSKQGAREKQHKREKRIHSNYINEEVVFLRPLGTEGRAQAERVCLQRAKLARINTQDVERTSVKLFF